MVNHRMSSRLLAVLMCTACGSIVLAQGIPDGPYFGQMSPGAFPQRFAPGVYSYLESITPDNTTWGVFNTDGTEYYYTALNIDDWEYSAIWFTEMEEDGHWTDPQEASFSRTIYRDWKLTLSPDGQRVFFNSDRPTHTWTLNIWMCERGENGWSEPIRLAISDGSQSDYVSSCAANGSLYYDSHRSPDGLFRSRPPNGEYVDFEYLALNSFRAWHTAIAPDESFLVFSSDGHADGYGGDDLYISFRNLDDTWTPPENLGSLVNTPGDESYCRISGDYLFYQGGGGDNWVSLRTIHPTLNCRLDPNGPVENLNTGVRYNAIQCAIQDANDGQEIVIQPGTYHEYVDFQGKGLLLRSLDPNDPAVVAQTVIVIGDARPVVTFFGETDAGTLEGITLQGGSCGVQCRGGQATLRHCRITRSAGDGIEQLPGTHLHLSHCIIAANDGVGMRMQETAMTRVKQYSHATIENCTIVQNAEAGMVGGKSTVANSIVYYNGPEGAVQLLPEAITVTYSCIQSIATTPALLDAGQLGQDVLDAEPRFATLGFWSDADDPLRVWVPGDYHLMSQTGRWNPDQGVWVADDLTSPCIDAGDPQSPVCLEPEPHGGCINMGAYGGTTEASHGQ